MADIVVHASRRGTILCGAKSDHLQAFYAQPVHRGTDKVTCETCLANIAQRCPICREPTSAGIETNYICDSCWRKSTVTFSMLVGNESMADFGAVMEVAALAATMARMRGERALRRERVARFWQAIQWFAFASSLMARIVRGPALFRWAAECQRRRALELRDGSQ